LKQAQVWITMDDHYHARRLMDKIKRDELEEQEEMEQDKMYDQEQQRAR
jgi:hypothetical protein